MTAQHDELVAKYRATPDILRGLVAGISDEAARNAGDDPDRWSIVEVVCHLRDAEARSIERTRSMRDQDCPTLLGYDEQELAAHGRYREQSLSAEVPAFIALRDEHARELEALDTLQWSSRAIHNQMGELTIQSITDHMTFHDAIHLAQIARRVAELRIGTGKPLGD